MLEITCCYVILHLNLKRIGFTGEPVTQRTRQSLVKNSSKRHATSCYVESYHDSRHNPNVNPKNERDHCETSVNE